MDEETSSSNMQRYFAQIENNMVTLSQGDYFHLTKVMRAKPGEHIEVVDQHQKPYLCIVSSVNPLKIEVQEPINKQSELSKEVTLFFGLAKSDKIELVIQKATELGAHRIILFQGQRSVVKYSESDFSRKLDRFNAIIKEAAEQCHREVLPEVLYRKSIKDIEDELLADINLFAYELEAGNTASLNNELSKKYSKIAVIIGPEGGFSSEEAECLIAKKFVPVSLGRRILRCETAAIYALSIIANKIENE